MNCLKWRFSSKSTETGFKIEKELNIYFDIDEQTSRITYREWFYSFTRGFSIVSIVLSVKDFLIFNVLYRPQLGIYETITTLLIYTNYLNKRILVYKDSLIFFYLLGCEHLHF